MYSKKTNKYISEKSSRIIFLDYLRVFAMLSVILFHISIYGNFFEPLSSGWIITNWLDILIRYPVPLFFMISGSLLLDENKKINITMIFEKYLYRIGIAFLFWAVIYHILFNIIALVPSIKGKWNYFIGDRHFWFLFTMAGLYLLLPILKRLLINSNVEHIRYLLILCFICSSIIPGIIAFFDLSYIKIIFDRLNYKYLSGYIFYFLLGYYLTHIGLKKGTINKIFVFSIVCIIFCLSFPFIRYFNNFESNYHLVVYNYAISINFKKIFEYIKMYLSLPVVLISTTLFIIFKEKIDNKTYKTSILISWLSRFSFGIYLNHYMFVFLFNEFGLTNMVLNPMIMIIIKTIIITFISLLICLCMNRFIILRKFIM